MLAFNSHIPLRQSHPPQHYSYGFPATAPNLTRAKASLAFSPKFPQTMPISVNRVTIVQLSGLRHVKPLAHDASVPLEDGSRSPPDAPPPHS